MLFWRNGSKWNGTGLRFGLFIVFDTSGRWFWDWRELHQTSLLRLKLLRLKETYDLLMRKTGSVFYSRNASDSVCFLLRVFLGAKAVLKSWCWGNICLFSIVSYIWWILQVLIIYFAWSFDWHRMPQGKQMWLYTLTKHHSYISRRVVEEHAFI